MAFQNTPNQIMWKMHFAAAPADVFKAIATDEGRSKFWAERTIENNNRVEFHILNFEPFVGEILSKEELSLFELEYYGTRVKFTVTPDSKGETDLELLATEVPEEIRMEMTAGWVSVLMALKGYVDFGVDLRNHDALRA